MKKQLSQLLHYLQSVEVRVRPAGGSEKGGRCPIHGLCSDREQTKKVPYTIGTSSGLPDLHAQRCKEYQSEQEQRRQDTIDAKRQEVSQLAAKADEKL